MKPSLNMEGRAIGPANLHAGLCSQQSPVKLLDPISSTAGLRMISKARSAAMAPLPELLCTRTADNMDVLT